MCIKLFLLDTIIDLCKTVALYLRDAGDEDVNMSDNAITSDVQFPFIDAALSSGDKRGVQDVAPNRRYGATTPPSPSLSVADALGVMSSVATGAVLRDGRARAGVPARSSLPEISAAGLAGGPGSRGRRGASFLHLHIPERGGWTAGFGAHHLHLPAITLTPAVTGAVTADSAPRKFSFAMGLRRLSQTTLHRSESMTSLCYRTLAAFVAEDNLPGMQAFLESRRVAVDDPDENGVTALMAATTKNKLPFVRELIAHGADVNAEDGDNWSALLIAAKEGFLDICVELLDHGADIEHKDMGGWTALMWACYKGRAEVATVLLDRGAEANSAGNFHVSSLLWAAGRGHLDIVQDLIRHGAKVNMGDKYGTSALVWASRKGHTEIVECLLNAGANVDTAGMYSWTALLVATTGNHVEVVSLLLAHKPNVNALDKDGCTALTVACKEGYHEVVVALLSAGAYINIQDRNGDTNLIHAVKGGHRSVVEQLLRKYADVDICGKDRKTAIYWAVEKGIFGIVKLLLTANPDLELPTKDGDTALLRAVRIRNADIVQLLLDKKAKVSAADKKGDTALHIAMRARSKGIVEVLLRNPKNSQLLYRPNRLGETPYNIDVGHQKTILGQIFGARRLNTNEDNENMLGYDLYSSALADILSEPSLSMPITVGLYAKWGSGKSFLLDKLREEMKNFARQWVDPVFQFTALMFLLVLHMGLVAGLTIGLATQSWIIGLSCAGGFVVLAYTFLLFIWYASQKYDWYWPYNLTVALTKKLSALKLVLQVAFCHPPGAQWNEGLGAQPIRFYFTEQTRVSSTAGGENSVVQMLGSLYDSIEADYGSISTRLYRAFRPKAAKSTSSWRWRRLCCVPYSIIFELGLTLLLIGITLLTIYLVDLPLYAENSGRMDKVTSEFVLIALALVLGVGLLSNLYTWGQMLQALFFSQRKHLQRTIAKLDTLRSEGFLQALRTEVTLMTDMVKCLDSFTGQQTRLVVIVDGLDSCEQDKVLLVLDAVHMLFSDTTSPFIVILAIDPHIISKAVELNSRRLFSESNIGGQDYLRNMVHLPFYLQNSGLRNVKAAQAAAAHGARVKGPAWGEPDDQQHFTASTNVLNSVSSRRLSTESGLSSCEKLPKVGAGVRKGSRKLKVSESIASSLGSNLNRVGGAQDLTKMLLTDDYFSDVNPRSMRRLMNVVYVTGRLLKAFQIDFNWYHLASWVNITEQWPFRTSWLILHHDNCADACEDATSLKAVYDKIRPQIPSSKDVEPLLELDRDERKFDVFLTFHRSSLLVSDLKVFLPFTINLDPYLKKVIKEEQQNADEGLTVGAYNPNPMGMVGPWGQAGVTPTNPAWPPASKTSLLRRQRPAGGKAAEPSTYYPPTQMMGWPQSWMGVPPEPLPRQPNYPSLHAASSLPPEVLDAKLSTLSVDGVCNLFSKIDDLSQSLVNTYTTVIRKNNINGRVLLHCDMDELKGVLQMNFGDWELFRMLVVSLREYELTSLSHQEENPKNVRFSVPTLNHPQQSSTERKDRNGKGSNREEKEKVSRSERQVTKQSVMEKQVTLEEQMICGALQTLNEEACEDVLDEADEKVDKAELGRLRSASQSSYASNAGETEMIFLQASPLSHPYWQPVSAGDASSCECSPAATPVSSRRSPAIRSEVSPRGPSRRRPASLLGEELPTGLQHLTPPPSPKHRVAFNVQYDGFRAARQPSVPPALVASALKRSSGSEPILAGEPRRRSRSAAGASDDESAPLIAGSGGAGDSNVLILPSLEPSETVACRVSWPMGTVAEAVGLTADDGLSLSRLVSLEALAAEEEGRLRKRSIGGSFARQNALDPEESFRESNGNISNNPETRV